MWRLYGGTGPAVALTLLYARLRDSLSGELFVGCVTYYDAVRDLGPEATRAIGPFLELRQSLAL